MLDGCGKYLWTCCEGKVYNAGCIEFYDGESERQNDAVREAHFRNLVEGHGGDAMGHAMDGSSGSSLACTTRKRPRTVAELIGQHARL